MAALSAAIGLLPASIATGIGSETQKPLARVVVGGMATSAVLILLVLPAMYALIHRYAERSVMSSAGEVTDGEPTPGD
jgi:cobalt-zinc-cadmium resistance protein CzcA